MATNTNHASGGNTDRKKTNKKKKQQVKIIIFIVEILIILAMLFVVWKVFQTTDESEGGPQFTSVGTEDVNINPEVIERIESSVAEGEEEPKIKKYWNIALFGLDATNSKQLSRGSRSDSIMVASINQETGDIKLVSVYRDTYLNIGNDKYDKCNAAYSYNGAQQSLSMLNMNMDLNITDFVAVGYTAVSDCVDALGGVWIEVDKEELKHINNYQTSIIRDLDDFSDKDYVEVEESGYQLLNGLQTAAYCRIRATAGSDFARAARQREVIKAMAEQAKEADLDTLTAIVKEVSSNIYTDIDVNDMIELLKNIADYEIVDEGGFPTEELRTAANVGKANCVIPVDLEANVVWLHEFLFEEEDYQVSATVKECSDTIAEKTDPYINTISD